ncbi:hypothetical protein IFM89_032182 [Coptis chinensis]|uniref:Bet v I/Major latex protein domain-containing protein n=1 Tax=Coptis chinensis TaxID=261450 RepID=A0A835MBB5_9MAGN|nr:hypothetical protein IFM89_032182 [Coptis chinensis]
MEVKSGSSAHRFWEAVMDFTSLLPPKNGKVLERDEFSVGSPVVAFAKGKVRLVYNANQIMVNGVIDGELTSLYKNIKDKIQVIPKGDGNIMKWSIEFENVNKEIPDPNMFQDYAGKMLIGLDAYIFFFLLVNFIYVFMGMDT